jgi:hypothetical protein
MYMNEITSAGAEPTYLKLGSSRKLKRLKSSLRLLFNGVPVIRIRWTLFSDFSRLKIRLLSDLTIACQLKLCVYQHQLLLSKRKHPERY